MANEMKPDEEPKESIYTYEAPWDHIKAMNWSVRKDKKWRLGIGSFSETPGRMSIVQLDVKTGDMRADPKLCFEQPYPATKMMFIPDKECQKPDLLATTSEHLRIWQVRDDNDRVERKSLLNSNKDPRRGIKVLTSFDWNEYDPKRIGTCCNDRTCTIWDIVRESVDAQMIAHDDIVHDISWGSVTDFATASADGSVRIFDVRHKDRALILYENCQPGPGLLRLGWNKQNHMYMATIIQGSPRVIVLDIRSPGLPVIELNRHSAKSVNAIAWAPHSSSHICSVGDDSLALIWDVFNYMQSEPVDVDVDGGLGPLLMEYSAGVAIEELQWSSTEPNWLAVAYTNKLQILPSLPQNKLNHSTESKIWSRVLLGEKNNKSNKVNIDSRLRDFEVLHV